MVYVGRSGPVPAGSLSRKSSLFQPSFGWAPSPGRGVRRYEWIETCGIADIYPTSKAGRRHSPALVGLSLIRLELLLQLVSPGGT